MPDLQSQLEQWLTRMRPRDVKKEEQAVSVRTDATAHTFSEKVRDQIAKDARATK